MNSYMSLAKNIKNGKTIYRKTYIDRTPIYAENLENIECITQENSEHLLYERFSVTKSLIICGGGHISVPVSMLAKMLGYHVIVFEDRPEFANNPVIKAQNDTFDRTSKLQPFVSKMNNFWVPMENMGKSLRNSSVTKDNAKEQTIAMNNAINSDGI